MKRLLIRLRAKVYNKRLVKESARRYREIEGIVYGYNRDENIYDKYQRVVRVVTKE